ncbi:MAG: hypothetical protein K6G81_04115 [Lachnospiraceae bacterium]|nr:hypothetical protein [Lachnospiraceae bacterium]
MINSKNNRRSSIVDTFFASRSTPGAEAINSCELMPLMNMSGPIAEETKEYITSLWVHITDSVLESIRFRYSLRDNVIEKKTEESEQQVEAIIKRGCEPGGTTYALREELMQYLRDAELSLSELAGEGDDEIPDEDDPAYWN